VRAMQHGLNTVLPGNYANTNLCQFRHNYTDYDFLSHGAGGFGYSGKIWEAPRADFERYVAAVARYKGYRHLLMGDYSRSAINTSFNTGTVVGVCANIFGEGMPPKFVPSFTWGNKGLSLYEFEKALSDISNWKKLKNQSLTDNEIQHLKTIFEQS